MSTDAALLAEVEALRAELEVAESALLRKGYRKTCDIAACNCGSQWNHGGNAEQRLSEIGEALSGAGFHGGTLLGNIETVCAERDALRADAERYRWLRDSDLGNQVAGLFRREWDAAIDAARSRDEH